MSAHESFPYFPPDYDPFAPRVLATSAYPRRRVIVVLRSDAKSERYALHRFPDGSVWWRADTFTAPEHPADPECWIGYGGELSVREVIERVPAHRREVLDWTRGEIAGGLEIAEADELDARERRARSLERLKVEIEHAA
jgi:hypothetical protein